MVRKGSYPCLTEALITHVSVMTEESKENNIQHIRCHDRDWNMKNTSCKWMSMEQEKTELYWDKNITQRGW